MSLVDQMDLSGVRLVASMAASKAVRSAACSAVIWVVYTCIMGSRSVTDYLLMK